MGTAAAGRDAGVVVAAAGGGRRFGGRKQFLELAGRPLLCFSLDAFAAIEAMAEIVVVAPAETLAEAERIAAAWETAREGQPGPRAGGAPPRLSVVAGGERRQDSVLAGLEAFTGGVEVALVHDAARPLLRVADVEAVLAAVRTHRAAAIGTPVTDSVKRERGGRIAEDVPRDELWTVQTPQGAWLSLLLDAYRRDRAREWTDEASALRNLGLQVALVAGSRENLKITRPGDEALAEAILRYRRRS